MTKLNEHAFLQVLVSDAVAAIERNNVQDTPATRRDLVRTAFACIEGMVWVLRQHFISSAQELSHLNSDEYRALEEVTYFVGANGMISSQRKFIPVAALVRLCVRITDRVQPGFSVAFDGPEWPAFLRFIEVRNALTHPKQAADIELSSNDLDTCLLSFFWVLHIAVDCIEAHNRALKIYLEEFRGIVRQLSNSNPDVMAEYAEAKARLEAMP